MLALKPGDIIQTSGLPVFDPETLRLLTHQYLVLALVSSPDASRSLREYVFLDILDLRTLKIKTEAHLLESFESISCTVSSHFTKA